MGIFSKFEDKMEDAFEGNGMGKAPISPVQIMKKAEKQMRREKVVSAGKQYAPTLYTVLVNPDDDQRLFGFYPTLAGECETRLSATAIEEGFALDCQPLVRFIVDEGLKHGKFDVVAEVVSTPIIEQLRAEEMQRYGMAGASSSSGGASGYGQQRASIPSYGAPLSPGAAGAAGLGVARYGAANSDGYDAASDLGVAPSDGFVADSSDEFAAGTSDGFGGVAPAADFGAQIGGAGAAGAYSAYGSYAQGGQFGAPGAGMGAVPAYNAGGGAFPASGNAAYPQNALGAQDMPAAQGGQDWSSFDGASIPLVTEEEVSANQGAFPFTSGNAAEFQAGGAFEVPQALAAQPSDHGLFSGEEPLPSQGPSSPASAGTELPSAGAYPAPAQVQAAAAGAQAAQSVQAVAQQPAAAAALAAQQPAAAAVDAAAAGAVAAAPVAAAGAAAAAAPIAAATAVVGAAGAANAAAPQVNGVLAQLTDLTSNRAYNLAATRILIGRETGNDIVVNDLNASRQHAQLELDAQGIWILTDLGSTNGTLVNGQSVQRQALKDGDRIVMGVTEYVFSQR